MSQSVLNGKVISVRKAQSHPFAQFLFNNIQAKNNVGDLIGGRMMLFAPPADKSLVVNLETVLRHLVTIKDSGKISIESTGFPRFTGHFSPTSNCFKATFVPQQEGDPHSPSTSPISLVPYKCEIKVVEANMVDISPKVVKKYPILMNITQLRIAHIERQLPTQEFLIQNSTWRPSQLSCTSSSQPQIKAVGSSKEVSHGAETTSKEREKGKDKDKDKEFEKTGVPESELEQGGCEGESTTSCIDNMNRTLIPGPLQLIINREQNKMMNIQSPGASLTSPSSFNLMVDLDLMKYNHQNAQPAILENCRKLRAFYSTLIKRCSDYNSKVPFDSEMKKLLDTPLFTDYAKRQMSERRTSGRPESQADGEFTPRNLLKRYLQTILEPLIDNLFKHFLNISTCSQQVAASAQKERNRNISLDVFQKSLSKPLFDRLEEKFKRLTRDSEDTINRELAQDVGFPVIPDRLFLVPDFASGLNPVNPTVNDNGRVMRAYGPVGVFALQFNRQLVSDSGPDAMKDYLRIVLTAQVTHRRKEYRDFLNVCSSGEVVDGTYSSLNGIMAKLANCIPSMFKVPIPLPSLLGIPLISSAIWQLASLSINNDPYSVFGSLASSVDKIQLALPIIGKVIKKFGGHAKAEADALAGGKGNQPFDFATELTIRVLAFCLCESQCTTILQCLVFCECWFPSNHYPKCAECCDLFRKSVSFIMKISDLDVGPVPLNTEGERPEYLQVASTYIEDKMKRIQENGVTILTKRLLDVYKRGVKKQVEAQHPNGFPPNLPVDFLVNTWIPKYSCCDISSLFMSDGKGFAEEYNFLLGLLRDLQLTINESFMERPTQVDTDVIQTQTDDLSLDEEGDITKTQSHEQNVGAETEEEL